MKKLTLILVILLTTILTPSFAQQVEVEGELKVTQMTNDDSQENLVIHNTDGTLGTRSVASLPPPPPPIDTTRNLASDYELAKHLCNCPNLPPFMIQRLLDSGYKEVDLYNAGVPLASIQNARFTCGDTLFYAGQGYTTKWIEGQCWMAENLNYGTRIDGTTGQTNNSNIEKYCYDDLTSNCDTYGGLYQWDEMMQYVTTAGTQGVCPTGWHLPTDDEWKTLEMQLGMTQAQADATGYRGTDQGSQLADNSFLWTDGLLDQNGAFGSSGFAALPGGYRYTSGSFYYQSIYAYYWSSSESGGTAWHRDLGYHDPKVYRYADDKAFGFSVRCVQD